MYIIYDYLNFKFYTLFKLRVGKKINDSYNMTTKSRYLIN